MIKLISHKTIIKVNGITLEQLEIDKMKRKKRKGKETLKNYYIKIIKKLLTFFFFYVILYLS